GVSLALRTTGQRSFVAGLFHEIGQMPIQPPGKRAEPENHAVQKRKALGESVAPRNVRHLVRDDSVELRVVPIAPAGRKQHYGAQNAHRDRYGDEFGFGSLWNEGKPGGLSAGSKPDGYAGFANHLR